jgi:hypothetical protein
LVAVAGGEVGALVNEEHDECGKSRAEGSVLLVNGM